MKHIFSLFLLLILGSTTAFGATLPFATTTIENGGFSPTTTWYALRIGASGLVISNNGSNNYIELTTAATEYAAKDLWCFVGDRTNGFKIYNKQAGATKVLASPKDLSANTGGKAYAILKEEGNDNYVYLWNFAESDDLANKTSFYFYQFGIEANKLNNRNNKLAFWTTGQDAGSSIQVELATITLKVDAENGTWTSTNANKTWASAWQANGSYALRFTTSANNMMNYDNANIQLYAAANSCTYTLTAPDEFVVEGYSFDFTNNDEKVNMTVTPKGASAVTCHGSETTHVWVGGLNEKTTSFVVSAGVPDYQSAANNFIYTKNFYATIKRSGKAAEPQQELYVYDNKTPHPYRIPAIATAANGHIFAISDYRPCGNDIGYGEVDVKCRISTDNGKTWGEEFFVANGVGDNNGGEVWKTGFGDAAIVADAEKNELLVMMVCGKTVCWNGNYIPDSNESNPNRVARVRAKYNSDLKRWIWTDPVEVTEQIYRQFVDKDNNPTVQSLFIGSGRICQSRQIKVGDYYRLYCSVWTKNEGNRVLYSDDFGENWYVLGKITDRPAPSGDEPKCEELPDGSVVLSSRTTGRYFNIYTYTDIESAEGTWATAALSNASNNGVAAVGNSTNGEIMIIPAVNNETQKKTFLALQSVPMGPGGRYNVGIFYKELTDFATDFASPAELAKDWDGSHQASFMGSAYSTMTLQSDKSIGFLYEESTHGRDYTIIYKNYTIEHITGNRYSYCADSTAVADYIAENIIDQRLAVLCPEIEDTENMKYIIGKINPDCYDDLMTKAEMLKQGGNAQSMAEFNAAINEAKIQPLDGKKYRLRNVGYLDGNSSYNQNQYLNTSSTKLGVATLSATNKTQHWTLVKVDEGWKIYNEYRKVYIGNPGAASQVINPTKKEEEAGVFTLESSIDGHTAFYAVNPESASHPCFHLASDKNIVAWNASTPSKWEVIAITAADYTAIEDIPTVTEPAQEGIYDLSGRRISEQPQKGIYIINRKKVLVK